MGSKLKTFYAAHKKAVLGAIALILAASMGLGIWCYTANRNAEPVYVYPFSYVGMTEYWGDNQESSGPVSSDNIQTVFLSETQTVTEILVEMGDTVKKGDLLMTFDTTLDSLKLERKRLDVEKKKLELQAAKNRLMDIRNMVPMTVIYLPDDGFDESLGDLIADKGYEIYGEDPKVIENALNYNGSSEVTPIVFWLKDDVSLNSDMVTKICQMAGKLQGIKRAQAEANKPEEEQPADNSQTETTSTQENSTVPGDGSGSNQSAESDIPSDSGSGTTEYPAASEAYVVIRVTTGNQMYAAKETWIGLYIINNGINAGFQFFTPGITDPFMEGYDDSGLVSDEIYLGSAYTAEQLSEMRKEQEKKIKDLEFQLKMVETEYKIMEKEFNDGNIYADVDGVVVSILTEEEAKETRQPVLKVSGGGGFYVEGFVNELDKDLMTIGMPVTVNDWESGMSYDAQVASIGDFPTQEGYWSGVGNPNSSYYPFQVFVDGSADLRTGSHVSITYSTAEGGNGIYLENPFVRTEDGLTYVLVQGPDGKLEQRMVTTGKSLWGSYTEILSGITEEDLIAFPYGKDVKPGVRTVEGDLSNLYG